MKRCTVAILLLLIGISLTACSVETNYNFMNPTDEISAISIVEVTYDDNNDRVQTEISEIHDISGFLCEFNGITCTTAIIPMEPVPIEENGVAVTVIKFSYNNGEYELVNWKGQSKYRLTNVYNPGMHFYSGYYKFDQNDFEALIAKYS